MQRAYGSYKAGEIVDVKADLAARLLAWEYAKEERQRPLLETATDEPEVERADVTPRRKGRRG